MHTQVDLSSHALSDPEHPQNLNNTGSGSANAPNCVPPVQLSPRSISDESGPALPSTSHTESSKTAYQSPLLSAPQSQPQERFKSPSRVPSIWTKAWRPQNTIIGLYALSIVLAAAHCLFFQYLDGRVIRPDSHISLKTTTIPQGYVTTISLLLITAFRAALVASVGVCYTQYLWATLRTRILRAGLVEDLFQIQTNAFHLTSTSLYLQTPILALVALFCWIVPLATVYPPGALVVQLQNLPFESALKEGRGLPLSLFPEETQNSSFLNTCVSQWGQSDEIRMLTRSRLLLGDMASLIPPSGENSSYSLQFLGTTLDCQILNRTIEKTFYKDDFFTSESSLEGKPEWSVQNFSSLSELWSNADYDSMLEDPTITYRTPIWPGVYQYYPCLNNSEADSTLGQKHSPIPVSSRGIQVIIPVTDIVCRPKPTIYSINVTFTGGEQLISYDLNDKEPLPAYSAAFANFNGSYQQWVHLSDAMSIYFDFAANLNRSTTADSRETFDPVNTTERSTSYSTRNGTTMENCLLNSVRANVWSPIWRQGFDPSTDLELWPLSVFERLDPYTAFNGERVIKTRSHFDAEVAKELLINTTISALALGQNFENVNGTVFRSVNVYIFQDKLAFFLPYALSIGLAIPIIALGLVAFFVHNQGVSAITGGFFQLLMTTTGRTLLEKQIVGAATLGGHENVTAGLRAAEITFGELIQVDDVLPNGVLAEQNQLETTAEQTSSSDTTLLDGLDVGVDAEKNESRGRRAGFGLAQEVKRVRRRIV